MPEAQMTTVVRVGHGPHPLDRKRYGPPRLALYWANRRRFAQPGFHLWTGRRHVRILPVPRAREARRG